MNFKIISRNIKLVCVVSLFINAATFAVFGQSIGKPSFQYTGMCARPANPPLQPLPFVDFLVDFNVTSLSSFGGGNVFYLQRSDINGSFTSPTDVSTATTITSSPASINFAIPANFVGSENYKFRVRSTNPVRISPESDAIYAYYKPYTGTFKINDGDATATICDASGVLLKINSPASTFTTLPYKWFRNGTLLAGQTSNTYQATLAGSYDAQIDYGSCTPTITADTPIIVNISTAGQSVTISSTNGNVVAQSSPVNLVSNPALTGFTYQWFLDNAPITGATSADLTTNLAGTYNLVINNGTCSTKSNSVQTFLFTPPAPTVASAVIPNIISPNNDGFNDSWEIPAIYGAGTSTNISILDSRGKLIFSSDNYINNWPQTTIDFESINPVFYYIITLASGEVKKGTITIVK